MVKSGRVIEVRQLKRFNKVLFLPLLISVSMGVSAAYAVSPSTVGLGSADGFAVLAGSGITNTGSSVISGDLGLSPGTSVSGFPPGIVNGTQHVTDTTAASAQTALTSAYLDAAGRTPVTTIPTELGGWHDSRCWRI